MHLPSHPNAFEVLSVIPNSQPAPNMLLQTEETNSRRDYIAHSRKITTLTASNSQRKYKNKQQWSTSLIRSHKIPFLQIPLQDHWNKQLFDRVCIYILLSPHWEHTWFFYTRWKKNTLSFGIAAGYSRERYCFQSLNVQCLRKYKYMYTLAIKRQPVVRSSAETLHRKDWAGRLRGGIWKNQAGERCRSSWSFLKRAGIKLLKHHESPETKSDRYFWALAEKHMCAFHHTSETSAILQG